MTTNNKIEQLYQYTAVKIMWIRSLSQISYSTHHSCDDMRWQMPTWWDEMRWMM